MPPFQPDRPERIPYKLCGDCRLLELWSVAEVEEYFLWRQMDAARNCANSYAYWAVRRENDLGPQEAHDLLKGVSSKEQIELIYDLADVTYNEIPAWQRLGIGLYWETYEKEGLNPKTGEATVAERRRLVVDKDLPFGSECAKRPVSLLRAHYDKVTEG